MAKNVTESQATGERLAIDARCDRPLAPEENADLLRALRRTSVFGGLDEGWLADNVLARGETLTVGAQKTCELRTANGEPALAVVLAGKVAIYSADVGRNTLLRVVTSGGTIGIAAVFASEKARGTMRTRPIVCADKPATLFRISSSALHSAMDNDPTGELRNALLAFLADRVAFLNGRIACMTGGTAERKLALYLKNAYDERGGAFSSEVPLKYLAEMLDVGRASLYRALDSLEDAGAIVRDGDRFLLADPQKLDQICYSEDRKKKK